MSVKHAHREYYETTREYYETTTTMPKQKTTSSHLVSAERVTVHDRSTETHQFIQLTLDPFWIWTPDNKPRQNNTQHLVPSTFFPFPSLPPKPPLNKQLMFIYIHIHILILFFPSFFVLRSFFVLPIPPPPLSLPTFHQPTPHPRKPKPKPDPTSPSKKAGQIGR